VRVQRCSCAEANEVCWVVIFLFFFLLSEENWLLYLVESSTSVDWRGSLGESTWFALEMFIQLGYFYEPLGRSLINVRGHEGSTAVSGS